MFFLIETIKANFLMCSRSIRKFIIDITVKLIDYSKYLDERETLLRDIFL